MKILNFIYPIIIICIIGCNSNDDVQPNYFQGKIVYQMSYFDLDGIKLDPTSINRESEQQYFISEGNYKSLDQNGVFIQLYNQSSNNYYFNYRGQVESISATTVYPKSGRFEDQDFQEKILDYTCNAVIEINEFGSSTHYYSPDLIVDKELYKLHLFGNWKKYLDATNGAIALKIETESSNMKILMQAVSIQKLELSNSDFDISLVNTN